MADAFTRNRLTWIERIATDPELSANATRLGVLLATKFLNRRTGECWPAIATLAELMAVYEKTIRRATAQLVKEKHLTCRRGGKGKPNRYRVEFFERAKMSDQEPPSPDKNVQSTESMTGHSCPDDRTILSKTEGQKCPPNPLKKIEPIDEPVEEYISPKSSSASKRKSKVSDDAFEEFWKQYPKRVAKGAARKAFDKALKKATGQELIAGAMRYAAEREGQDPQFTKHPTTWLNAEAWLDEPAPHFEDRSKSREPRLADIAWGDE